MILSKTLWYSLLAASFSIGVWLSFCLRMTKIPDHSEYNDKKCEWRGKWNQKLWDTEMQKSAWDYLCPSCKGEGKKSTITKIGEGIEKTPLSFDENGDLISYEGEFKVGVWRCSRNHTFKVIPADYYCGVRTSYAKLYEKKGTK